MLVNDFGCDGLGVERPLTAVLVEQALAEQKAEIDGGQAKLSRDLFEPMRFATMRAAGKER